MSDSRKADHMEEESRHQKVALITGGTRGIGRATALKLASEGWAVFVCYKKNEADAASLREEISAFHSPVQCVKANVMRPDEAKKIVDCAAGWFGHIDALINCVGEYHRVSIMDETDDRWRDAFDNNLHSVFYLCQAAASGMIRHKRGRIINFGIVNAEQLTAQPFITAHYIAKAGVVALTRAFAKTLAPYGITANVISPGFIDTGGVPPKELAKSFKSIPAGYMGNPEDVASLACWLLSDEARYVNGANIQISGAWGV